MRKLSHARLRRLEMTGVKSSVVGGYKGAVRTVVFTIGLAGLLRLLVEVDSSSESEVDAQLLVTCCCTRWVMLATGGEEAWSRASIWRKS